MACWHLAASSIAVAFLSHSLAAFVPPPDGRDGFAHPSNMKLITSDELIMCIYWPNAAGFGYGVIILYSDAAQSDSCSPAVNAETANQRRLGLLGICRLSTRNSAAIIQRNREYSSPSGSCAFVLSLSR